MTVGGRSTPGRVARVPGAPPLPFADGSVSFRLYAHNELEATDVVDELALQAALAIGAGFDGIMTSEHHGGFGGYLPSPLLAASFVLESQPVGWAAPCPLLLPLRPTVLVAEEVAWLQARHPGRVGLGVAAGASPRDFAVVGTDRAAATTVFVAELPTIVALLRGEQLGELEGDPALRACRDRPVPVVVATVSAAAARRAAALGAGILLEGMSSADRLATVTSAYLGAGGIGPRVLIRRVWLGELRAELVAAQRAAYDRITGGASPFGADQTVHGTDGRAVVDELVAVAAAAGATALNLRVHLPGMDRTAVRDQLDLLGEEVVPRLKERLAARSARH